jgi:hypothetical protein
VDAATPLDDLSWAQLRKHAQQMAARRRASEIVALA